ncbi:MAG TPA: NAD(P)-dependent oxidoreductase [Streptosporangiaceae bacterium]
MGGTALNHRLGWLGTGRMGSALARRLLAAGCELAVYNRTSSRAEPLADRGASVVTTPAALAAAADIVFITVGGSDDLLDVVTGPGGLISGPSVPAIVVDCSTVSAEASQQVRDQLKERGSVLLAAPVMGNARVAEAGRLTLAVSGPEQTFDQARPYLDLLGAGATYVGDGETARIVKLCHNLLLGVVAQTLAEVTILAQQYGVSRHALLECLNNSVMGSAFTRYKTPALVNLDFSPTFTASLLRKDFDLGLAAARAREVPLPVAALVHQLVQGLVGRGHGGDDFAALLLMEADSAGLSLASEDVPVPDGLEPDQLGG